MDGQENHIILLGASGGIGTSIAKKLIKAGHKVIGTSYDELGLKALRDAFPENMTPILLDLGDIESIGNFLKFVRHSTTNISWLINSAGFIDLEEPTLDLHSDAIKKTFTVNASTPAEITYRLLPYIQDFGGIIHISSTAGIWGNPSFPIYSASKSALNTFSRSIAKTLTQTQKRVIALCPGPTNTEMRELIAKDSSKHQNPDTVAEVVLEIIQKNSAFKNGDTLIVRDGKTSVHSTIES
jgi:short-subunit dehydrogenase